MRLRRHPSGVWVLGSCLPTLTLIRLSARFPSLMDSSPSLTTALSLISSSNSQPGMPSESFSCTRRQRYSTLRIARHDSGVHCGNSRRTVVPNSRCVISPARLQPAFDTEVPKLHRRQQQHPAKHPRLSVIQLRRASAVCSTCQHTNCMPLATT